MLQKNNLYYRKKTLKFSYDKEDQTCEMGLFFIYCIGIFLVKEYIKVSFHFSKVIHIMSFDQYILLKNFVRLLRCWNNICCCVLDSILLQICPLGILQLYILARNIKHLLNENLCWKKKKILQMEHFN